MEKRTPRRLGLSRISPKIQPNSQTKRLNEATNTVQSTSKANEDIENTPETANDFESFETPTKKRKVSLGRFDFTPKQQTNDLQKENEHKTDDVKTDDELKADIQEMKERLEKYKKYNDEKKELEQLIETWKVGGIQALRQLQVEIQPKQELEQILEHFKLPTEIFGDITE